jgi:hypothetical protein
MKTNLIFLMMCSLLLLFGCTTNTSSLEIDDQSIIDLFWENYLIEAAQQNVEISDQIQNIHIFGYYYHLKDIGDNDLRFYIGDESIKYVLHAFITFKEASNILPQYYAYEWYEYTYAGNTSIREYASLQLLQQEINLKEFKADEILLNKNVIDDFERNLRNQMTEDSTLDIKIYDKQHSYQKIQHQLSNGTTVVETDNIIYLVKNDKAILAKYIGQSNNESVTIQKYVDEKPVTEIYRYAFKGVYINQLTLPNTIQYIGRESFAQATVSGIIIEESSVLKVIEDKAFYQANFFRITIPIGVHTIGVDAFNVGGGNRINAEVLEKPNGWHEEWVRPDHHVIWGYKPE